MKIGLKSLIATFVIAMHALGAGAAMNTRGHTPQPVMLPALTSAAEATLPEVVVTASAINEWGGRNAKHAVRCEGGTIGAATQPTDI